MVFTPADEISHRYADQSHRVLQFDPPPKKGHCRLNAAPVDVLPHGSGKFGHVLEVDLQKRESSPVNRCVDGYLPHGSGNFGHGPFFGKFDAN